MDQLPMVVWQDKGAGRRVVLHCYPHTATEVATLEILAGKDAMGTERWQRAASDDSMSAESAMLGMAQLLRDVTAELAALKRAAPQPPDLHAQAEAAYREEARAAEARLSGAPLQQRVGPSPGCPHRWSQWHRSERMQNTWRQCSACAEVEVRSAQAGREALDPHDPAYLSAPAPGKLSPAREPGPDPPF